MQRDAVSELFGLAGTFPRPGWVVLDAARDHRFTGELVFDTSPPVRMYFDRGTIYLAERAGDPSIAARLVDAGALTATQLERGSVRVGEVEHLGRLFDRVPELDRHAVMVTVELMTEECAGWLAGQRVPEVQWTPYRHHPSGIHQWQRTSAPVDLHPGDPLPAPPAEEEPVALPPPLVESGDPFLGEIIQWNEPSWLDDRRSETLDEALPSESLPDEALPDEARLEEETPEAPPVSPEDVSTDWVDRLDTEGLPEADPLMAHAPLPRLGTTPLDRFEIVWPSGEIDEDFGGVDAVAGDDHDRVGATARLARPEPAPEPSTPPPPDDAPPEGSDETAPESDEIALDEEVVDQVVLAVRRAVASIEVGSLAIRQRLVTPDADAADLSRGQVELDPSRGQVEFAPPSPTSESVAEPGRLALRSGRNDWSQRTVTRSIFDEPAPPAVEPSLEARTPEESSAERRAGALRRLIASLRR